MPVAEVILIILTLPVAGAIIIPVAAMWMHHKRKMEELRQKEQRLIGEDIRAEFESIRAEIRDLRDVTMQYDLSFDTALQQVERRLNHLEKPKYTAQPVAVEQDNILHGGRS